MLAEWEQQLARLVMHGFNTPDNYRRVEMLDAEHFQATVRLPAVRLAELADHHLPWALRIAGLRNVLVHVQSLPYHQHQITVTAMVIPGPYFDAAARAWLAIARRVKTS